MWSKIRLDGGRMNEAWKRIIKKYIDCYEAIKTLKKNGIMVDEEAEVFKRTLLDDIIETLRSEVEK